MATQKKRISAIDKSAAGQPISSSGPQDGLRLPGNRREITLSPPRGLTETAWRELQNIANTAGKIPHDVDEVARRLNADPNMYEELVKNSKTVKDAAEATIERYRNVPPAPDSTGAGSGRPGIGVRGAK